jgi:hypothetical protein
MRPVPSIEQAHVWTHQVSNFHQRTFMIRATPQQVHDAARLCNENVQRLLRNAKILLNHDGSDGLVYVLWSLAVEEFGKGILLEQQVSDTSAEADSPARPGRSAEPVASSSR